MPQVWTPKELNDPIGAESVGRKAILPGSGIGISNAFYAEEERDSRYIAESCKCAEFRKALTAMRK